MSDAGTQSTTVRAELCRPLRGLERGEGGAVDLDPQARAVRDRHPAVLLNDRLGDDRHPDRMLGLVEFQQRLRRVEAGRVVRQAGDKLQ